MTNEGFSQFGEYLRAVLKKDRGARFDPAALGPEHREWCTAAIDLARHWLTTEQQLRVFQLAVCEQQPVVRHAQQVMAVLRRLAEVAGGTFERDELCEAVVTSCVQELELVHAVVFLADAGGTRLVPWSECGMDGVPVPAVERDEDPLAVGTGAAGAAVRDGQAVIVEDLSCKESYSTCETPCTSGSLISLPLRDGPQPVGALNLTSPERAAFGDDLLRALGVVADWVGLALRAAADQVHRQTVERERMLADAPCVVGDPWGEVTPEALKLAREPAVLIAAGDDLRLERLASLLVRLGLHVDRLDYEGDLRALCEQVMSFAPDAVLVDLSLPGNNGWPLLGQLARARLHSYTAVMPFGFDPRSGQAWLGRPSSLAAKGVGRDAFLAELAVEEGQRGTRALLVENNPACAQRFSEWLHRRFDETIVAGDGAEGIEHVLDNPPAQIVCDALMPDRCGLQLVAELSRREAAPPCLLMLPERPSAAELALLTLDAQWTAAFHGAGLASWAALLGRHLAHVLV